MDDINPQKRGRRGGGRDARRSAREASSAASSPYLVRGIAPVDMLSDEACELIEHNAETVLEEIGIEFRDDAEALAILKDKGCDIDGERVHFPRGKLVGRATSGGYGYRVKKSLALAMLAPDLAAIGTCLEIDILGQRYDAVVIEESPFDPANEKLRA